MRPLDGKVAIVTGGSRGIGRGIALRLASDGARCVLAARDREALAGVARDIEAGGGEAAAFARDLREPQAPGDLAEFAATHFGGIDIVVNNAGATRRGPFLELPDEDWLDGFALKFFGAVRLARAAWPYLKRSGGSLVNVAGVGGRAPGADFALGGSVNAALMAFTKALADTGRVDGVQVNTVNPGAVRTDRFERRVRKVADDRRIDRAAAERQIVEDLQVTRIGEPADIASLVAFVVGPEGRFLHGALLDMDGGATKAV